MTNNNYAFFLGGNDLEMQTIRQLLLKHSEAPIFDKRLAWGAASSDYESEIIKALKNGFCPVLIELKWNSPELNRHDVLLLDHHDQLANTANPTPLEQLFTLLQLPDSAWTRKHDLVVANDKGHIKALQDMGATQQEIYSIRKADRAAQGVTEVDEQLAQLAIKNRQIMCNGQLQVINSQTDKTSPITDQLALEHSSQKTENILIFSPNEINFYGRGSIVELLAQETCTDWYGGNLPLTGYWGTTSLKETDNILEKIESRLLG